MESYFFCSEPPTANIVQPSTKYKIVPIFLLVATYNVQDYVLGPQNIVKRGDRPSKNGYVENTVLCTTSVGINKESRCQGNTVMCRIYVECTSNCLID